MFAENYKLPGSALVWSGNRNFSSAISLRKIPDPRLHIKQPLTENNSNRDSNTGFENFEEGEVPMRSGLKN